MKDLELKDGRCLIMAEIASAHCGDLEILKIIFRNSVEAKADLVKVQIFNASELCSKYNSDFKILSQIQLNQNQWKEFFKFASLFDVTVFAEVFDLKSAEFAADYVDGLYVHAADLSNPFLLNLVGQYGKPTILNVGGSTIDEIRNAIECLEKTGNKSLILMYGIQNFPTSIDQVNLSRIKTLQKEFNYPVGYHDHTNSKDHMALSLNLAAYAYGAKIIEKHVTDDRSKLGFDYISSLHKDEFALLVQKIRDFERSLGHQDISLSEADKIYRKRIKKFIVANDDLPQGTILGLSHLAFKRTQQEGFSPDEFAELLGRRLTNGISKDNLIRLTDLE